ncbi:phage shock protein PspC (stress-responsive transcriptional regulator)/FtsH-binding integral membrane protein [Agromyces cerinus]|uniref:PspC domain-containing protein n=1 Tax=Agromyces cerinus TaxID=33878 RepID=UPI00195A95C7|nr:PspC domain-containing protein [Agromyces cerinus]MBM7831927.1 phage shock protein PspC (stress-responsive transcriptional regulator)/FtsH-binding integral membrane protein [Agromyces cerinus]
METNSTAPEADPVPDDVKGDSAAPGPNAHGAAGATPSSGDPGAATPAPGTGTGFYDWLRRLGVPRRAGWLGGVCAGVGARLGIDPIIVRGIVVVVAVLGAPFVLLYAIAWLLLPDTEGEIHLERLIRGIVDPAIVGIAVMGVIGLIPLVQGGWLGWRWWPDWPTFIDPIFGFDLAWPLRVLWVLIVVGAIIAFVVWLAQRASQNSPGGAGARMASATTAAAPGHPSTAAFASAGAAATASAPAPASASADTSDAAAAAAAGASTTVPTTEPPVPAEGADAAAIAEWRAQHEAWRVSHAEWKSGQEQAERAARAQAAAENKAKARELTAQADAARAARRASRPRASAAFVFTVLGLALVGGSIAAIWSLATPDVAGFAIPIALAVATLLLSVGMVVAALRRRRSGGLAFMTTLAALSMSVAVLASSIMPQGALVPPAYGIPMNESQRLVQPFGDAHMFASPALIGGSSPVIELRQGTGDTSIRIEDGAQIVLDASEAGPLDIVVYASDFSSSSTPSFGGLDRGALVLDEDGVRGVLPTDGPPDATIVLEQGSGMVHIEIREGE